MIRMLNHGTTLRLFMIRLYSTFIFSRYKIFISPESALLFFYRQQDADSLSSN
jgi:hypothetical protein